MCLQDNSYSLAQSFANVFPCVDNSLNCDKTIASYFVCVSVTNYSPEWETASTHTITKYKAGTGKDIDASIGVHIGLRGVNITLKGKMHVQLN